MRKYSVFAVVREAMRAHKGWEAQWVSPEPRQSYDVIIIGAGGHGLGAAYYLAKEHGVRRIAVLEKGWLGGGNTGRNTTIIRSNYLLPESIPFYEWSMKLWEGLLISLTAFLAGYIAAYVHVFHFSATLFAPVLAELQSGKWHSVTVLISDSRKLCSLSCKKVPGWKFWQRGSLEPLFGAAA
mgnify:CR=1 FL=1